MLVESATQQDFRKLGYVGALNPVVDRNEKKSTSGRLALLRQAARERGEEYSNKTTTLGWQPNCSCNAKAVPCVVLDPFGGSGTVGAVAERLGRNSILIELNPEYVKLAKHRTAQNGLLLEVA